MAQKIAGDHGGTHFARATDPEERRKLWQARHDAYYAGKATRPGVVTMYVCRFPGWPNASSRGKTTSPPLS